MNGQPSGATTTISITGMTCEHCVASVTEALGTLEDVQTVSVELNPGGISTARIRSGTAPPLARISQAVGEVGYVLLASRP